MKLMKYKCLYCLSEISAGEYFILAYHKLFNDRIEMYHYEDCFLKEKNRWLNAAFKPLFIESDYRLEKHRRPYDYEIDTISDTLRKPKKEQ